MTPGVEDSSGPESQEGWPFPQPPRQTFFFVSSFQLCYDFDKSHHRS